VSDVVTGGRAVETEAVPRRVSKPWGNELIWALTDRYCGKIITINTGSRLSLQYHERKDEWLFVMSGRLLLELEDETGELVSHELGPGDSAHVPVLRRHRYTGVEQVELIEVSSPEIDDVVRLQDDYGREGTSAP
jgi:mannose-6-phosphate isomerase